MADKEIVLTEQERKIVRAAQSRSSPFRKLTQWDFALLAVIFFLQFVAVSFLAVHRLIDSDEGFYLYISKLVATIGVVPYKDVFYQQMPLLLYVYGAWMKIFGFSWEAGRLLSAFLAAVIGTLLFWSIRRTTNKPILALSCALLYAFNLSMLLFFLTAKTYVLSTALLFGSLLAGTDNRERHSRWIAGVSGLLLALSVETRLFFTAVVPVFAIWFWARQDSDTGRMRFWHFLVGFSSGLIPSLIFIGVARRQFIYDNLLYHSMRDPAGLVGDFQQKAAVARQLIIGAESFRPTQFFFLLLGVPLAIVFWRKLAPITRLAAASSVMLGLASFLPTPTFGQYFCVLIPFLILCLAGAFENAVDAFAGFVPRKAFMSGLVALTIAYSAAAVPRIQSLFLRGEGMPGIGPATDTVDWRLSTVKEIAGIIESNSAKDSPVVTSWPGYLLTIDRNAYPKMENQISVDTAWKLSAEEADELKMLREVDLLRSIADANVTIVVAGNCTHGRRQLYHEALFRNNYKLISRVGNSEIYVRH